MKLKRRLSIICLFAPLWVSAQITFTSIPMDSQLVARNPITNLGTLTLQGQVDSTNTSYDSLFLKIYRNNLLIDSVYQPLFYTDDTAAFSFSYLIPAELKEYKLVLYGIKNSAQTPDTIIDGLVAGDVFIIDGQSNAFAMMRDGGSANGNKSEYIRSFADADSSVAGFLTSLRWFTAEGDGGLSEYGHVGQWGIRLGRLLVDSMKIPIAIFNGACGGTPITYYMRPPNYKTSIYSNYGRLYYRLNTTGLAANVRAIMWSQGETDAKNGTGTSIYVSEFDTLEKNWLQDFPNVQKTYIFQTRNGGMPTYPFHNLQLIKEAQREVVMADTNLELITTSTLRQDSGDLHFDYSGGYEIFGNRVFNIISRDLYGKTPPGEIDAPLINGAYMTDSTTIIINESADSLIAHKNGPITDFELENAGPAVIDSISLTKSNIVLKLSQYPGQNVTVSYLAQPADSGNWVTNTAHIEIACFYMYPVADSLDTFNAVSVVNHSPSTYSLYPNPNNGYFTIKTMSFEPTSGSIFEIYNVLGEKIYTSNITSYYTTVDISSSPKGIYQYRIIDDRGRIKTSGRIIIQ